MPKSSKLSFPPNNDSTTYTDTTTDEDNASLRLEITDLDAAIDLLAKNPDVILDQIPKDDPIFLAFEKIKLFISIFFGRPEYPQILDRIGKQSRPSTINPGSAGAFLFGCSQDNYGDIDNKFCSPLCAQSVLPKEATCCPYQIWIWSDQQFEKINESQSPHAYVFITHNLERPQFTTEMINLLKLYNINSVHLLTTLNSKHLTLLPLTPIDQLPLTSPSTNSPSTKLSCTNCPVNGHQKAVKAAHQSSTAMSLFTFLIIVVIIIAAIWLFVKYILPRFSNFSLFSNSSRTPTFTTYSRATPSSRTAYPRPSY